MELSQDMDSVDYYRFLRFQTSIFRTLQERGYYLKGIEIHELRTRERDRLADFVYKQWCDVLEFEKD